MKRILVLVAAFMLIAVPAMARLHSDQDIGIEGVGLGSEMSYVEGVYGKPTTLHDIPAKAGVIRPYSMARADYKGHFSIWYIYADRRNGVIRVETEYEGMATPAGVTVGMDASAVGNIYGRADYVQLVGGQTIFSYVFGNQIMNFAVKAGTIRKISIGYDPEFMVGQIVGAATK